MKLSTVKKIVNGILISNSLDLKINKLKIDSRKVKKGDLFIAIKGNNFDGHDFIEEAVVNGAAGIIVEKEKRVSLPQIIVKSTNQALLDLASYIRKRNDIPVIAVTGSVGKTTTKELLSHILSAKYNVLKSEGNFNNHIGIPLTFFELRKDHSLIVLELGMNHLGEIKMLSNLAKPNTSIITNVGSAHIGNLGSIKNIKDAKLEILSGMSDGDLIINSDNRYLKNIKSRDVKINKVSQKGSSLFKVTDIECFFDRTKFLIHYQDNQYPVTFYIPGYHLITNVLLAIHTSLLYGINISDIIEKIEGYQGIDQRMNLIYLENNNVLIDDCYNSSYESLMGLLGLIKNENRFKIIILGDILELGNKSYQVHKKIIKKLKEIENCLIILVGEEFNKVKTIYDQFLSNEDVINYLEEVSINKMIIMLKGSRKLKLEEIRDYLISRLKKKN